MIAPASGARSSGSARGGASGGGTSDAGRAGARDSRATLLWERFVGGDGLTLTLLSLALLSVALPLQQGNWAPGMPPPLIVAALGGAAGYAMSRAGWSGLRTSLVGGASGLALAIFAGASVAEGAGAPSRLANAFADLADWIAAVPTDETRAGLVEFAMFLTLVVWAFTLSGAWLALRRAHGWTTVLLGGVMTAFALSHLGGWVVLRLAAFMTASAALLIHLSAARRMAGWRARGAAFDSRSTLAHSGVILGLGLLITAVAAVLPAPSAAPLGAASRALDGAAQAASAHFARLFSALPARRDYHTITFDERTHFQGEPNFYEEELFTVQGPPTYWRARTYAVYEGDGWATAPGAEYAPFEDAPSPEGSNRARQTHEFRVAAATDTLFTGGLPAAFDRPAEGMTAAGAGPGVMQARFSEGREYFPTRVNLNYVSTGLESTATAFQLRRAGEAYPEWADAYLQLPETLPRRVRALAERIAADAENPYDAALAVRDHVIGMPYRLDVAPPPEGADGVDYFLFESQEGYCDYHASAAAVLLRAAGIPSRYVLGYATGVFNPAVGAYEVTGVNYHAWVEAYFPGYGWIPFEPTPPDAVEFGGQGLGPPPVLAEQPEIAFGEIPEDEDEEGFVVDFAPRREIPAWVIGLLGVAGALAAVAPIAAWRQWWWKLGRLPRPDELFAKMARLGAVAGVQKRPHQTAMEYADALAGEAPSRAREIGHIAAAYALRRYAPGRVPLGALRDAERAWSSLRWALLRRAFRLRSE